MTTARRLRIMHVILQLDIGGMEKLMVEFARHADRARFDLQFVCLGSRGKLAEELEQEGWPVTALGASPGLRPGLMIRLARLFRKQRPDVVHTHNTKPLLYAAPAARLARVPVIVHTRHGQRFQAGRVASTLFRLASHLTRKVVAVSEDGKRLSAHEGVPANRLITIRNGIDTERFQQVGPCPSGPVVMVGRLSPEKDVGTLLRAAARVVHELPNFRLEIAGDGECKAILEALAAELGLDKCVRFLGEVRDIAALLGRASLFVLPSLTEGISVTVMEAMATGLPVVATRVGGNPEVIAERETGLLVPAQNPGALADAMLAVLCNPAMGEKLGRAGRSRVEVQFDVRVMVAKYEALFLELLGMRNAEADMDSAQLQVTGLN